MKRAAIFLISVLQMPLLFADGQGHFTDIT